MSSRQFEAFVRVAFDSSAFQSGLSKAQKAYHDAFADMGNAINSFQSRGAAALQTATQLSLIASTTSQYRQGIQDALNAPSEAAASLESALAAASTVVTPELSIDGDYAKTMDALRAQALAWGDGVAEGASVASASAADYAATTYSMLSAGLQAEAAMNATSQAFILAKGTMGDAGDAANLLAMAYNTMGDKAIDSGVELQRLSDVVAKTQAAFQIANLNQLSEGLKYAIPTAQRYRIEWEEISTIIGQLNTSGLTGSQAGTSFASMMAQMIKASKSLGFQIAYDDSGAMSVIETLGNIQAKFGDITKLAPNVQLAFDQAFGQEGARALTLLMTALDSLSSNFSAIADSEGQAELMASRMSDTYADSVARMNNARSAMQARIGASANSIRGSFVNIRTGFYEMVSAFLDTAPGDAIATIASGLSIAADGVLGFGTSALNVAAQLATFVAMTQQAGGIVALFKASLGMVGAIFSGLGSTVLGLGKTVISTFKTIGVAFYTATGPVGVVIAALMAAVYAGYQVYKHWETIKTFFSDLWEGIKNIFSSAISWIVDQVVGFIDWVATPFKWLAGLLGFDGADEIEDMESFTVAADDAEDFTAGSDIPSADDIAASMAGAFASAGEDAASAMSAAIPESLKVEPVDPASLTLDGIDTKWAEVDWEGLVSQQFDADPSSWATAGFSGTPGEETDYSWASVPAVQPVIITEESETVLTRIKDLVSEIVTELRDGAGRRETITIDTVNLPRTDDIDDVLSFVASLREQIGRETA